MLAISHRQRFAAILDGQIPDRMAWVPRLRIWHLAHEARGTLPEELRGMTLPQAEAALGMARSAREARIYKEVYEDGVEEIYERQGDKLIHRWRTPVGEAFSTWQVPPVTSGLAKIQRDYYIKTDADWKVMEAVGAARRFVPIHDSYHAYDAEIGEDGYPLVILGESPFHEIMLHYLGYERGYCALHDTPERVESLRRIMEDSYLQMWEVVAASPAQLLLHGIHFSGMMTPPPIFKRYFMPYFQAFNDRMHRAGKRVALHADADLTGLLDLVLACDFDVADTFACAPLVRCTFEQARAAWGHRIVIWGALPSIILEPCVSFDDFKAYMRNLFAQTTGRPAFILAVSDNIMPGAELDRLRWVAENLPGI